MSERFEVRVEGGFRASHDRGPDGAEIAPHEHDWRVAVYARSRTLDAIAIVVDFRQLRDDTEALLAEVDCSRLEEHDELRDRPTTALAVAAWLMERLAPLGTGESWEIHAVEVEADPGIRYRVDRGA